MVRYRFVGRQQPAAFTSPAVVHALAAHHSTASSQQRTGILLGRYDIDLAVENIVFMPTASACRRLSDRCAALVRVPLGVQVICTPLRHKLLKTQTMANGAGAVHACCPQQPLLQAPALEP